MRCIKCKNDMVIDTDRRDFPYIKDVSYRCSCGVKCLGTTFGGNETYSITWYNRKGEYYKSTMQKLEEESIREKHFFKKLVFN